MIAIDVWQAGTMAELGLVLVVFVDGQGALSLLLFGLQPEMLSLLYHWCDRATRLLVRSPWGRLLCCVPQEADEAASPTPAARSAGMGPADVYTGTTGLDHMHMSVQRGPQRRVSWFRT